MQKPTFKNKSFTRKQGFTLIELLIVIAIIGILFIVLVSKVDFATDKAKATGVQTDFRSFQIAFETVSRENAGFNTFGWDTGDVNQDGIRNSYDEGDTNKDGIQNGTEVFTGHKVYSETFTKVYSLKKNGTGSYDRDALNRLETAINANLDPKLHITIKDDGEVVMANGAKDPWNKEYHGWYITNAETDGQDRGAIVMYSDGANNEFGSEHTIANGVVKVIVPGNNKNGKDDYSIVSVYTYTNGYGEVQNVTTGFSNNQLMSGGNTEIGNLVTPPTENNPTYEVLTGSNQTINEIKPIVLRSESDFNKFKEVRINGDVVDASNYEVTEGSTVITFKSEFIATLDDGQYTVQIVSEDGYAETTIYVEFDGTLEYQYINVKYLLYSSDGVYFIINENGIMNVYNPDNTLNTTIPSMCLQLTATGFVMQNTGTDFDNINFTFTDGYRQIQYLEWDNQMTTIAIKHGTCSHLLPDNRWYNWYDGTEMIALWKVTTTQEFKNYTLKCSTCGETMKTKVFADSDYVYLYNMYMEPQVQNGEHVSGTCADVDYIDVGGWVAVAIDFDKTNNLYTTIDGEPVAAIIHPFGQIEYLNK